MKILPALSMWLLYSSFYMGLIVVNLRGASRAGTGDVGLFAHFALVALVGVILYFLIRKGFKYFRALAVFLGIAGFFCVIIPFLPLDTAFSGRPPLVAICMAVFTPVSFMIFFRAVPPGREGLYFALVMMGSELLWAILFPLLGAISEQFQPQQILYLFSLCSWMLGGAGICLAISIIRSTPEARLTEFVPKCALSGSMLRKRRTLIYVLFVAAVAVFCLMGLHMGKLMPKTAFMPEVINVPHFIFLALLPFAGWLVDEHPKKFMALCGGGLIGAIIGFFLLDYASLTLFYQLNFLQQILLLALCATIARLLKAHTLLPLLITLAYCLYPLQLIGVALRNLVAGLPFGLPVASLLLTLGVVFCLWRFRRMLSAKPALWAIAEEPELTEEEKEMQKLCAFAVAHALTARERDAIYYLTQGVSREDMAQNLDISARTLRHHLSNLQKKLLIPNEKSLLDYYNSWKA